MKSGSFIRRSISKIFGEMFITFVNLKLNKSLDRIGHCIGHLTSNDISYFRFIFDALHPVPNSMDHWTSP